jgi:hypothetical protein
MTHGYLHLLSLSLIVDGYVIIIIIVIYLNCKLGVVPGGSVLQ